MNMNIKQYDSQPVKVSVCVITYNHVNYIGQCLESILNQKTNFTFEIIVADDASTDGTIDIIRKYATKHPDIVKPVFHDKNVGVYQNYKDAHSKATGTYVAHCDGDDYWYENKLEKQILIMDSDNSIVQSWTGANIVDDSGCITGLFPSRWARKVYPDEVFASDIALSYALVGQHSTQIYRRESQPKIDKTEFLDYWVAFNLALKGKSRYLINENLSAYRCTSSPSLTRHSGSKKVAVDLLSEHLFCISKNYPEYSREAKSNLLTRYFFSKLKRHDTRCLQFYLKKMKLSKISLKYLASSFFYFLMQKIR